MSNLTVTTINTANGTTDMTVATGNTSAPKMIVYSNGAGSYTNGLVRSNGFINGSQTVVNTTTTLTTACFGTMIQLQSGPYTVTVPNPSFNGACFQIWTNTTAIITLSTPVNNFVGPNGSSASTVTLSPGSTYLLSSDGSNWIITTVSTLAPNIGYTRSDSKAVYTTSTSGVIISDLNSTITPRKSNSNILITYCINFECDADHTFRLYRSIGGVDTLIGINVNDGNYWSGTWMVNYDVDVNSTGQNQTLVYLDTPSTTSQITYKLQVISSTTNGRYFCLNRTYASTGQYQYEVGISQAFLQEIGV